MNDNLYSRAQILIQQGKFDEAAKALGQLMSSNPNDISVLGLYCEAMIGLGNYDKAEELVNHAISLSPDIDALYYIKSRVLLHFNRYDEAEQCLKEAVRINPYDADYYAFWASINLSRKRFELALEMANKSLELDSRNILGLNIRSTALDKLNKNEESYSTIEGALKEDPNNPYTHANYGWNLLHKGEHKKAMDHFKEALKNDPNMEYAQGGMAEAMKARYALYRWFMMYYLWMSDKTSKYQWGVIIGFYLLIRGLNYVAVTSETLQPFVLPIIILLVLIAFSTWVMTPISNLFLRLNPYGKHLLNKREILSSNFVGISVLITIAGLLLFAIIGDTRWLTISAFGFIMMVPLSSMLTPTKHKYSLIIYTSVMCLMGIMAIVVTFSTGELFNGFSGVFITGFIGFQWIVNYLMIKEDNV